MINICRATKFLLPAGIISVLLFISCNTKDVRSERILEQAHSLLEVNPESALILLDSVIYPQNGGNSFYNRYQLAYIQAKDKSYQSIEGDSMIFGVKKYFDANGTQIEKALSSYYMGRVIADSGDYDKAFVYFNQAEEYSSQLTDAYNLKGLIQHAIGNSFYKKLTFDEAKSYYRKALESFYMARNYNNMIIADMSIGTCFLYSIPDSSFYYYNQALDIAKQIGDNSEESRLYNNLGLAFFRESRKEESVVAFKKAIAASTNHEDKKKAYINIAKVFTKENTDSAYYYLNKVMELDPEQTDYVTQINVQRILADIHEHNKDFKAAVYNLKLYNQYLDKEFKKRNNEQALAIQKKYNYERVKNENSRLAIKTKDMWIGFFSALSAILVLAILAIYYYKDRHRRAQESVLEGVIKLQTLSDKAKAEKGSMMGFVLDHFDVLKKAALLEGYLREDEKKHGRKLLDKFNETIYGQNSFDWDKAIEMMNHIYDGFCDKLLSKYPELDQSEFRVCCLVYSGLKNPEIGIIMGYMLNTVQAKKYSIRKKLGISGYGKIIDFLNEELRISINQNSEQEEVEESEKIN